MELSLYNFPLSLPRYISANEWMNMKMSEWICVPVEEKVLSNPEICWANI